MVDYSVGIGCIVTVCLLVMGGLGFIAQDSALPSLININDPSAQVIDASQNSMGGIFTNGVSSGNPPWQLH